MDGYTIVTLSLVAGPTAMYLGSEIINRLKEKDIRRQLK